MTNRIVLTDPAFEAGELAKWLQQIPVTNDPAGEVLAGALGVAPYQLEHAELLFAVKARLGRLRELAEATEDPRLTPQDRTAVAAGAQRLSEIFDAPRLAARWSDVRKSQVVDGDLFAIVMFSPIAKDVRPLRLITQEDRGRLFEALSKAIADLKATRAQDPWLASELLAGLQRLELITRFLPFFGHEVALGEIQSLVAKVEVVRSSRPAILAGLGLAAGALFALADAYMLPHDLAAATGDYRSVYLNQVRPALVEYKERLRLPPPSDGGAPGN